DAGKQADQANSTSLEAITVTARRREETLQDVPIAITALSAKTLETLNVQNLGDLQGNVPNLVIHDARGSRARCSTCSTSSASKCCAVRKAHCMARTRSAVRSSTFPVHCRRRSRFM